MGAHLGETGVVGDDELQVCLGFPPCVCGSGVCGILVPVDGEDQEGQPGVEVRSHPAHILVVPGSQEPAWSMRAQPPSD